MASKRLLSAILASSFLLLGCDKEGQGAPGATANASSRSAVPDAAVSQAALRNPSTPFELALALENTIWHVGGFGVFEFKAFDRNTQPFPSGELVFPATYHQYGEFGAVSRIDRLILGADGAFRSYALYFRMVDGQVVEHSEEIKVRRVDAEEMRRRIEANQFF